MTFNEFRAANPMNNLECIDREEITTLYSVGHYDGPMTGVAEWKGKRYYCKCDDINQMDRTFLLIEIGEKEEHELEDAVKLYAITDRATGETMRRIANDCEQNGKIVGWFVGWSHHS